MAQMVLVAGQQACYLLQGRTSCSALRFAASVQRMLGTCSWSCHFHANDPARTTSKQFEVMHLEAVRGKNLF